ncbi:MAG: hypothetical protein AUK60_10515 [Rhodobacteraceae bacterium CG2_30_10_405]|nr:MAG: hypothetical protein AUK60_10515 [Rhodobacteraceae bacterium CG2_30_10_405]
MRGSFTNQIVGLVRFSYPALNGFTRVPADLAVLTAQLYDPARLARRFHLFEHLTLPSLLAQTDPDFQTLFVIGTDLPEPARDRLQAAIAPLAGGRIVALEPMLHYGATQKAFAVLRDARASHVTSFRLDDDDALDCGFIARLRATAAALLPVATDRPLVISANRGFFLRQAPGGNELIDVVEKLPLGVGLAMVVPQVSDENIFRRNHRLVPQYYNTFTDADTPAFIRSVHRDNDSQPTTSGISHQMTKAEIKTAIETHFPFTLAAIEAL